MLQDDNQIAKDSANQTIQEAALAQKTSNQAERASGIAIEQAESARVSAKTARGNSQTTQDEKTSLVAAEAALTQAKDALITGEKARKESEESRRKAKLARRGAEEARCKAEEARTLAEEIRDQAETAQSCTESERASAEEALEETQDHARQQELLAQKERLIRHIFQAVHSGKTLEDIFQLIVDKLGTHLTADRCFISRYDPKKCILSAPSREYRSSEKIQPIIGTDSELWQGLGHYARILCEARNMPMEFDRECSGTSSETQEHLGHIKLESGIGTSIHYLNNCLAVLFIHQVHQKRAWSEAEKLAMQMVAEQIGIAIYQSELLAKEQATRKALEQSNQDLEHFAVIASHDLQAPLRKIKLFCEQIYKSTQDKLDPETLDLMQRVNRSIDTAQALVSDLLSLSKVMKTGQAFQIVELSWVLHNALTNLEDQIQKKQAQIEIQQLVTLMGDSQQLEQLFQNLIDNGLKYQPPGQKPVIKIHSECFDQTFCEIIVEDNGIGFDPAYAERIFSPFERLHGRASPYTGTGVGLAICKRIVERHEGTIQAESRPGQGAKFTVRLPYRPDLAKPIQELALSQSED